MINHLVAFQLLFYSGMITNYQQPRIVRLMSSSNMGGEMTILGGDELKECASHVRELSGNKRIQKDKIKDVQLISKIRTNANLEECEIDRLLNLHIDKIQLRHRPQEAEHIRKDAVYLFYKNKPRVRKNLEKLTEIVDKHSNPAAVIRPNSISPTAGKGYASHFNGNAPEASIIARGARVALQGRNFNPVWGLHNGACGTVEKIVFSKGSLTNQGNLPEYVVVHFPLYCGPIWDLNNPKVSHRLQMYHLQNKNTN